MEVIKKAWINAHWISTTPNPVVAFKQNNGNRNGVVVIDLSKIQSNKIYFPIDTMLR